MADLTKVYVAQDTIQLADVVDNFRVVCLKNYGLDPFHYISAPSLAMDAMLKETEVELELLTDRDMHLFFEKGIPGGISMITGRYSKATIRTCTIIIQMRLQNISCTSTQIICAAGP